MSDLLECLSSFDAYLSFLRDELGRLPAGHRIAFAASIAERLLPNYVRFHDQEQWGDPDLFRRVLTRTWEHVLATSLSDSEIDRLVELCVRNAPDMDEFCDEGALIAASAVVAALECCRSDADVYSVQHAAEQGYSIASLGMHWIADNPRREQTMWSLAEVQRELRNQLSTLRLLKNTFGLDAEAITKLRTGK